MKSTTLITTLTGLTTFMAVVAPVVVFGFLYFMRVQPERAAAANVGSRLAAARDELNRQRSMVRPAVSGAMASPRAVNARTTELSRAGEFAAALVDLLKSPAVGGVSNLSVHRSAPVDGAAGPMARTFAQPVVQLPVTLTFNARYEQIERFFGNLRAMPTTFAVESVELTPLTNSAGGLMRATVSLLAFHVQEAGAVTQAPHTQAVDMSTPQRWARNPSAKERSSSTRPATTARVDPKVTSVLFSGGRRVAIVDGLVVGPGDRVRDGIVRSIEPDAVVIAGPGGHPRRVEIARRDVPLAKP